MLRLYLNQKTNEKLRRKHRKKTDLMLQMIQVIERHARGKTLHFLGDSAYTGAGMLPQIPDRESVTGRIGANSRLVEAPRPNKGQRGRLARRGPALPKPQELLAGFG